MQKTETTKNYQIFIINKDIEYISYMREIIRLSEKELKNMIAESVRRILNENNNFYQKNILMQKSIDNGAPDEVWESFLAEKNTFYGAIAKLAQQNNHRYTDVLTDLQNKILNYANEGRFGNNQDVINTVNQFCMLLAYLNGAFESAVNRLRNQNLKENVLDYVRGVGYKDANRFGVQQKVGNDRTGEWMRQLQGELQQLLQWNYLHGPKTIKATNAFIEFLEVEKRGMNIGASLNKLKTALVGIAMLGNVLNAYAPNISHQNTNYNPNPTQTTQTQQQMKPQTIQFNVNSAELTQQTMSVLQQMGQNGGSFNIVVHQSQNSSGKDASYEGQLVQQRAQNIKNALGQNVRVNVTRGNNTQTPYVEVIPGN